MNEASHQARLQELPSVDKVVGRLNIEGPPSALTAAARRAIDEARAAIRSGADSPSLEEIVSAAQGLLQEREQTQLRTVINATGVLIHTNLGRSPLGPEQLEAVRTVASAYSNLEYDLLSGGRGSRYEHAAPLLAEATGGEDAVVVNNNAAAVLLVLAALCRGREVIISRGELIEIGGEFRMPDVMAISGAELVEVGTTNRTQLSDYEKAITERTAAIMKVHPSNYRVVGFTADVPAKELAKLARGKGLPFVNDLGSGLLAELGDWSKGEPLVTRSLQDGADLVTFSGDKLLGGPQAGIVVGRRELVGKLRAEPLIRALRVDKMTLAALEATIRMYLSGRQNDLPLRVAALAPLDELERRAKSIAEAIDAGARGLNARSSATQSVAGGGSLPEATLDSWAVLVKSEHRSSAEIQRALRAGDPPVISRAEEGVVVLDLRAVPEAADRLLIEAIRSAAN